MSTDTSDAKNGENKNEGGIVPSRTPPECEGLCYWRSRSELNDNIESILDPSFHFCESDYFRKLLTGLGIYNATFQRNRFALAGNAIFDKFSATWKTLEKTEKIGIVFHGTRTFNINNILQNGLDKNLRKGQAYGPGEYFSKEAGISVGYCHGGLQMLVCAVILPVHRVGCPKDYVVVKNNDHHFPLGTISFSRVDLAVVKSSLQQKDQFRELSKRVYESARAADEAALKAKIIQNIIAYSIDIGSELYTKKKDLLSDLSKREIAMYVHRVLDKDVLDVYFPGIPAPMKGSEHDKAPIKRVEVVEREANVLKQQLDQKLASLTNNVYNMEL